MHWYRQLYRSSPATSLVPLHQEPSCITSSYNHGNAEGNIGSGSADRRLLGYDAV